MINFDGSTPIPYLLLLCFSIPLSLFMLLGNEAFSKSWSNDFEECSVLPSTRWLSSLLVSFAITTIGLRLKYFDKDGAALGMILAFISLISNHVFFVCLGTFFFSASKFTLFRRHLKKEIEKEFKIGDGKATWKQVLSNAGMATQLVILYLIYCGCSERPIDFDRAYRSSWLGVAVMSSLAGCNGDTWAHQLGILMSKSDPFLITTFKSVPKGTNGGVSIQGLLLSILGGLSIGLSYYLGVCYTVDTKLLVTSPPQWPIIVYGGVAGIFGSVVDSVLGALFQYSGITEDGKFVKFPELSVRHISGLRILDDHSVNIISSIITGVTIPMLAFKLWPKH